MRLPSYKTILLAVLLPCLIALAQTPHPACDLMVRAAERERAAQQALWNRKLELELADSTLDPLHTGVIGVELSSITTTMGYLKSKRSATHPDFAAHLVRELLDHGIGVDDSVVVSMTGSFPGLNLAVLCALETLGVPSLRFCSIGASSFGANQEAFTWLDMEDYLRRERLLKRRSDFVTLGGTGDIGGGLSRDARRLMEERAFSLNYPLLRARSLKGQMRLRRKHIGDPRRYALLINVGGNHAMLGNEGRQLPGGWNDEGSFAALHDSLAGAQGIVFDFLEAGVPVLNLLHIESVARDANLPFDFDSLQTPGLSPVYFLTPPPAVNSTETTPAR